MQTSQQKIEGFKSACNIIRKFAFDNDVTLIGTLTLGITRENQSLDIRVESIHVAGPQCTKDGKYNGDKH